MSYHHIKTQGIPLQRLSPNPKWVAMRDFGPRTALPPQYFYIFCRWLTPKIRHVGPKLIKSRPILAQGHFQQIHMGGSSVLTEYGLVGSHGDPVYEVCCSKLGVHLTWACARNVKKYVVHALMGQSRESSTFAQNLNPHPMQTCA